MPWDDTLTRIMALSQWPTLSIVAWAARHVEPYFRIWMREDVYIGAVDSALTFAERCIVEVGEKIPLSLPEQIALITDAAAAAARSTWEDDLDPDSRPSGYANSAYSAAAAAVAVSALLRGLAFGLWDNRKQYVVKSLVSSIESTKHNAASHWTGSYDGLKAAEDQAEADFIKCLEAQVACVEGALSAGPTGSDGIPWKLFCAENPIAPPRYAEASRGQRQVFISYSHVDSLFVTRLYRELRRHEVSCWLDEHDSMAGDRIMDSLADAIRTCTRALICCSQASLQSKWVKDEMRVAEEEERRLGQPLMIPIMLDSSLLNGSVDEVSVDLRSRVAVDFSDWERSPQHFNRAFNKLYKALRPRSQ